MIAHGINIESSIGMVTMAMRRRMLLLLRIPLLEDFVVSYFLPTAGMRAVEYTRKGEITMIGRWNKKREKRERERGGSTITFPILPIPIIPKTKPLGSVVGTNPRAPCLHFPSRACLSARLVSFKTARIRNIVISAVASDTAFRVLQNQIFSLVIQSTSNSL